MVWIQRIATGLRRAMRRVATHGLASAVLLAVTLYGCTQAGMDPAALRGGETRATLSPAYFTGRTAAAYEAAGDIPEVIDSIHCYCECKKHHGHKSLLTCFVDGHGAHCDVCINEALYARELHAKGDDVVTIRKAIDAIYTQ